MRLTPLTSIAGIVLFSVKKIPHHDRLFATFHFRSKAASVGHLLLKMQYACHLFARGVAAAPAFFRPVSP